VSTAAGGGLPRWLAIGIGVLSALAIVTGARSAPPPRAAGPSVTFDTAFVRANGFMMDSLRLGRSEPVPPAAAARKRRPAAPRRDSVPVPMGPRGCLPE
jgi:hypothetical protein